MRFLQLLMAILLLGCFSSNVLADDLNLDSPRNKGMWRFEIDNDAFLGEDSNFSNGWSIQHHGTRFSTWEETNTFVWIKWVGQHFPTLGDEGSIVRFARGIGQNIVTPGDITNSAPPVAGELPYAATLHYNLSWQRFNSESATIFQYNIGVLGEEAYGEWTQKFVHDDLGMGDTPMGWDTQRDSEPILNLAYGNQWRVAQFGQYDNAWGGQMSIGNTFHLGNLLTAVDVGFAFRYGWNIPEGFGSYPAPPGRGLFTGLTLAKPASASPHSYEFVLAARATGLAYSVLYDGSEISDDEREVEREDYILAGLIGINYHHYDKMSIRLSLITSSDLIDEDAVPPPATPGEDQTATDNSYGTIMIDYYF